MNTTKRKYLVLDQNGNPIMRKGDEVNPYIFYSLRSAFEFAEQERKELSTPNKMSVSVVEIKEIETLNSN